MVSLGNELGGHAKAEDMIKGRGVSLIMKSTEIQFRRPVTFPDTVREASFIGLSICSATVAFDRLAVLLT
jgi:hypothetical protein